MSLALAKDMTLEEFLERHSPRELVLWEAFYEECPFGPEADDLRHGILCSLVANSSPYRERAAQPKEFMLRRRKARRSVRAKTAPEIQAKLQEITSVFAAAFARPGGGVPSLPSAPLRSC